MMKIYFSFREKLKNKTSSKLFISLVITIVLEFDIYYVYILQFKLIISSINLILTVKTIIYTNRHVQIYSNPMKRLILRYLLRIIQ